MSGVFLLQACAPKAVDRKPPGGSHPVQVEPILRTIILRIGIICNCRDLTRCRKVFCMSKKSIEFHNFPAWTFVLKWVYFVWEPNGRVGVGALISLFLDFTAPHLPVLKALNRNHPGVPNEIQVDTLPNWIATSQS